MYLGTQEGRVASRSVDQWLGSLQDELKSDSLAITRALVIVQYTIESEVKSLRVASANKANTRNMFQEE
jgi:hypothetical protein